MNKKTIIFIAVTIVVLLLAGMGYLIYSLNKSNEENKQMLELAEMDKREMENEYESFARQYNEMKTQINNDSLMAQLEQEQQRTQELLEELRRTKSNDAAEIARLKKELATMRQVLKSFVAEIDSLNRLNTQLSNENENLRQQQVVQQQQITNLSSEKASLTDKVEIASQLDATAVHISALNERQKAAKKIADVKTIQVSFNIARNVTAAAGARTIYVRIVKPTGDAVNGGGTFAYENRNLEYAMRKDIEYNGEETPVTVYWNVTEMLVAGQYRVQIFADGKNIGGGSISFEK
jgi:flagellar basal body-associated protein FliL